VLDLSRRGLSQIYIGNAVQMRDTDLGDIISSVDSVCLIVVTACAIKRARMLSASTRALVLGSRLIVF